MGNKKGLSREGEPFNEYAIRLDWLGKANQGGVPAELRGVLHVMYDQT